MNSINQCALFAALLNLLAYIQQCQGSDSSTSFVAKACASKLAVGATINATNRLFLCDCTTNLSSNSSDAFEKITCAKRKLNNNYFNDYLLPDSVAELSMDWNSFDVMPKFSGNGLRLLDMSHNNITTIDDSTFENVTNLIELDLSWNRIETIADRTFHKLAELKRLDISHNRLTRLPEHMFAVPSVLEVLILSNNEGLGEQFNHPDFDLFETLGVPETLSRLEVNDMNLERLHLNNAHNLRELFASYNRFNETMHLLTTLYRGLEILDLSGNPFNVIPANFTRKFIWIREVFLRRMPYLERVEEDAFADLMDLIVLDFDGSKNLVEFHEYAFGSDDPQGKDELHWKYLERFSLRGAKIERLGSRIAHTFHHLKRLDLYGNPLNCDCNLRWVAKLDLETNGRCNQPEELKGELISNIPVSQFTCLTWPNVVYVFLHGVLLLSLFAIFSIPIWLIVMCTRSRRHHTGRTIGATSPYARITIESNRAEDNYF